MWKDYWKENEFDEIQFEQYITSKIAKDKKIESLAEEVMQFYERVIVEIDLEIEFLEKLEDLNIEGLNLDFQN